MKAYRVIIPAVTLLFLASFSYAQDIPKKGAVIKSESNEIVVQTNQLSETKLQLVRSRVERKRKFDVPQVQPVSGLIATIKATDVVDEYILTLKPTEITPGKYNLIVKGAGNNKHLITGTMLSVIVEGSATFSSSN